jgi:hypothetical protein
MLFYLQYNNIKLSQPVVAFTLFAGSPLSMHHSGVKATTG